MYILFRAKVSFIPSGWRCFRKNYLLLRSKVVYLLGSKTINQINFTLK